MDKRFAWIFLAASAAFFLFIVGLTGYRIEAARRTNTASAEERLRDLATQAAELRDMAGSFETPSFKEGMRSAFDREARLLLLSIHSEADGILYLVTRNRTYLREPAEIDPGWRGVPSYQYSRGYEALASRPLETSLSEAEPAQASIDALFVIMGREDLYPVLRDDLYLFLAFLLVCGVYILIVTGLQRDETEYRQMPTGPAQGPTVPEHAPKPPTTGGASDSRAGGWAERTLLSPSSGLVWAEHLEPRLRAEIDRAASSDQDLSFASLRIDRRSAASASSSAAGARGGAELAAARASIAKLLRETFASHDLLFEIGEDSFAVILPDTDVDQAVKGLDALRKKASAAAVEGKTKTLSVGVSSRAGRLVEEKTLLEEAGTAREKATREGGNRVVGFRADPARYRRALSG